MRQVQATADAETKKSLEEAIKQMSAQVQELDKNPQMKEMLSQGAEAERVSKKNAYEANLKSWNEDLPEDPRALIAKRIRQFLATAADVDFSAALISRGDQKVFVKEEYEQKSAYWKTCFRAGKDATEAASAFAKAWLAELEKN
jgi:DNA-binding IclR family transcriptional regulator